MPEDGSADHDPVRRGTGIDPVGTDRPPPIWCTTSRPRVDICVVHLAGELDIATVPLVADYLRRQTATLPAELLLDLTGVTLLGATGLTLIVAAMNNDEGIHGRLHLVGVTGNRPVERALRITGLLPFLDVHEDVQSLLDRLR
jgi:anti-anti-sigma factor